MCVCVEKEKESTQEKDSDSKNGNPSSRVALWTLGRVIMWSQAIVAGIFLFLVLQRFVFVAYSHKIPRTVIKGEP